MWGKNKDLICWLGLCAMIYFFPNTSDGAWDFDLSTKNPHYHFNKFFVPAVILAVIIFRRWRNR